MNTLPVTEDQLRKYANEISRILLELSDERIAEIFITMNSWKFPDEFKSIYPYSELSGETNELNFMFWQIFDRFVRKIVPEETLTKTHYRLNLSPKVDWDFSFDLDFDFKESRILRKTFE